MSDDAVLTEAEKAIKQRGYAQGYAAGKRRLASEISREEAEAEREAWRRQVFLAALPVCIAASGWQDGEGKPITTMPQKVQLAISAANTAVKCI